MLRRMIHKIWYSIPESLQWKIVFFLSKGKSVRIKTIVDQLQSRIGYRENRTYAKYLCTNFEKEVSKIKTNPMFVKINLDFHVGFNAGVITNVIEYTVSSMRKGMIPVFYVNNNIANKEKVCLEWLILQPYNSVFGIKDLDINKIDWSETIVPCSYRIETSYLWHINSEDWIIWKQLASKIIVKNDYFEKYCLDDKKNNKIDTSNMLGVLIRGTDYVKLKPKFHPVQPDIEEVIKKIHEVMNKQGYSNIYVATDEKRVFQRLVEEFGEDITYSNTREYYDELYREDNLYQIWDAKLERNNDAFLRSVEYISSMFILSECKGLIGGNCSGGVLAALFNKGDYIYFFNLGYY